MSKLWACWLAVVCVILAGAGIVAYLALHALVQQIP